jgi:hypothetical protein
MPYYDDRIHWAYASISKDKDLACTDDGKSILLEDGSAIVHVTNSKVSMTVPATLINLVSFFQGMSLHYNDGQETLDIVTFPVEDFIDDMQLKCKIWQSDNLEILVNLETLNFIENLNIASIPQTSADYICKSKNITPPQMEHILHPKALSPLQEETMSHHTLFHHLPFPKLLAMAKTGEIPPHLASLKRRCPICVACLFGTAHKRSWHLKLKQSLSFKRNQIIIPVPFLGSSCFGTTGTNAN